MYGGGNVTLQRQVAVSSSARDVIGREREREGERGERKVHTSNQLRAERFTALILPVETVYP